MRVTTLHNELAYAGQVTPYRRDRVHMSLMTYVLAGGPFGAHRSI